MKKLIGIVGYRGVGKTTARQHLQAEHLFVSRPFAGPLKNMLRALGLSETHLSGELKEEPCDLLMGQSPRFAMQTLGTDWGRYLIHPDFWTTIWRRGVTGIASPVVADDVRFLNEARTLKEVGGTLIRIHRDGYGPSDHVSETELDCIQADYEIPNNGTPGDLFASLDAIIR